MIEHFTQADSEYGRRIKEGIEMKMKEMKEWKIMCESFQAVNSSFSNMEKAHLLLIKQQKKLK